MDGQQKQNIIDLPKTLAGAVAAPLAAVLTSRFGIAGTMVGLALSAVIVTVMVDTLKVYLARVPGAVTSIPGGFKKKSVWGRFLGRLRLPFSKLSSLPSARRRSILIRSLIGGLIMFVIGLVVVTGVEMSVGKNLSCWVWDNCYTESSAGGEDASDARNLPSIFIASNSISASAPQVDSPALQPQPAPRVAPTPPVSPSSSMKQSQPPVSEQPSAPASEQQSSPSSDQQLGEYPQEGEYQQQSEYSQPDEYQQLSPTSSPETQQQSPSNSSENPRQQGFQQQSSPTPPLFS